MKRISLKSQFCGTRRKASPRILSPFFGRLEGGLATFRKRTNGHSRKDVFLTCDVCTREGDMEIVFGARLSFVSLSV